MIDTIFFFFNDTATTEIYTLSLHDALPILPSPCARVGPRPCRSGAVREALARPLCQRSEEHTSELQSQSNLVCRLLLEKKKTLLQGSQHFRIRAAKFSLDRYQLSCPTTPNA